MAWKVGTMKLRYSILAVLAVVGVMVAITLLSGCVLCRTRESDEFDEFVESEYIGGGDQLCELDFDYSCEETQIYGLEMVGI